MDLLLNADIGFLPPDCSDVQLSGEIFLRARNEARGREALPWLICTRATASDDYRGVSLQRGRHREALSFLSGNQRDCLYKLLKPPKRVRVLRLRQCWLLLSGSEGGDAN